MHQIVSETYVISIKEFITLLKGMGYKKCYGMVSEEIKFTEQEVINILKSLTEKNIITSNGEEFILHDEYRKLLTTIGTAEYVMVCNNSDEKKSFLLYVGNSVIMCKHSPNNPDIYSLKIVENDSLGQLYCEELIIPRKSETELLNELLFEDNMEESEPQIYSSTEIINVETNEKVIVSLMKGFLSYYLTIKNRDGVVIESYTEQKYKNLLSEITGGKIRW